MDELFRRFGYESGDDLKVPYMRDDVRADEMRVMSRKEFSAEAGISLTTLDRLIKRGDGPPCVRLSPRRIGIRRGAGLDWLKSREVA